jgi:SAM-dependent methyltransferase
MTRTDFDRFAHDYEALLKSQTRLFDSDHEYFARYKVELMKRRTSIDARNILDFGCGTGRTAGFLHAAFPAARVVGCDPSHESLKLARTANPGCVFSDPGEIALRQQFDLVIASCVFHHIPPRERGDALRYCMERLNDNGQIFIFEHNPFNPITRHLVKTCPFDTDAVLLTRRETVRQLRWAGFKVVAGGYCLFFPGVLSRLRGLEKPLGWLPLGGQYYVAAARPVQPPPS